MRSQAITVFLTYLATAGVAYAGGEAVADAALPSWLTTLLGSAPSAGILVWYIYYTTAVRNPQIEERYSRERKEAEDRFDAERQASEKRHFDHLSSMISSHRTDLAESWKAKTSADEKHEQTFDKLSSVISELATEIRQNRCGFTKHNAD